jgi:FkbM family methyltransferase
MSVINVVKFIMTHPLNRDNKLKSIIRFVKWQIGSRLVPGAIVYDWINGSKFLVCNGETGLTGNIYTGLHEFQDMAFLLHVLRDDDLFIDVGANVGSYTILACSAIGARGYAFEPVPATYKRLVENIHLNYLDKRVQCFNIGVGGKQGRIDFTSNMDTTNHALASDEQNVNKISVEISTLDKILKDEWPAFIKIDVEGYETLVLEGASETLKKGTLHSVIMELNGSGSRYGFDESRILETMFDHGFRTYSYNPIDRTLIDLQGKNLNSGNTLFIRDEPSVLEKLMNSPKITVNRMQF